MDLAKATTGYVVMTVEGLYLVKSERTTHTGHHVDWNHTSNLNEASVFPGRWAALFKQCPYKESELIFLAAVLEVQRKVTLVP